MFKNFLTAEKSEMGEAQEDDIERRASSDAAADAFKMPSFSRSKLAKFAKKGGAQLAKAIEEVSQGSEKTVIVKRYLPKDINGVPVLIPELGTNSDGGKTYMVDSTGLEAAGIHFGERLAYRMSKDNSDKDRGIGAYWGETISGIDEEDGWVQVEVEIDAPAQAVDKDELRLALNVG